MENKVFAFGYSRKSPDDEEDTEISLRNQKELIQVICKGKEWNFIKMFTDRNISGGDNERKGINDCIKESMEYKVKNPSDQVYIIVKDSKRFARESSFFKNKLKNLDAYGVKVFSIIKNNFLDYKDIGDRLMSVIDEQAIIEGEKNAKLIEGLKMSKNLPCIPAPFGYKYGKDKNWVIVQRGANIVSEVVSSYLRNINYKEILKELKIDKSLYYRIIKNYRKGLYSGIISYEKKIKDSDKKIIRIEKIEYEGTYQKIISDEIFKKV